MCTGQEPMPLRPHINQCHSTPKRANSSQMGEPVRFTLKCTLSPVTGHTHLASDHALNFSCMRSNTQSGANLTADGICSDTPPWPRVVINLVIKVQLRMLTFTMRFSYLKLRRTTNESITKLYVLESGI